MFRLGKKPPRLDPRTLQLADYLRTAETPQPGASICHPERSAFRGAEGSRLDVFLSEQGTAPPAKRALPPAPRSVDWTAKIPSWPMFSNDTVGDCTTAAAAHMIQCWTANAGDAFTPTDAQVIAAYSATAHYVPGNPATDTGAVELDVLNFWRQQGIAGHKIDAYVSFSAQNFEHTCAAINIFGGIYVGLALPLAAQTQDVWRVPSFLSRIFLNSTVGEGLRSRPPSAVSSRLGHETLPRLSRIFRRFSGNSSADTDPGSWGGHAVPILAYDSDTLTCITWGAKKRMTWEFFARYCDEAYAPLSPDWLNAQGKDPEGLNIVALQADLTEIDENASCPQ